MKINKRIIPILVLVCLAASILSGCSYIDLIREEFFAQDTASEADNEETEAAGNAISNDISLGIIDFDTFNPLLTHSETIKECMQLVYEPLFEVDEQLRPVPVLADSYTVSPDGRTIDIQLKTGVLWHDGSLFTPLDVAYTFKQIKAGLTVYTDLLLNVASYTGIDDDKFRITLNYAVPDFVSLLTFPIIKYRSDMSGTSEFVPVGTGPFYYASQISAGKLNFSAFDSYHGGRALIDGVYVYTLPDITKYKSMFEASEIDLMTGDTVDLSEYTPRGSVTNNEYITNKLTYLGFNTQNPLLSGAETRKGLAKLVDKESIVKSVIYSHGVAVDVPINPSSIFYYDTNTKFKSDEILAFSYLGNDGWGINEDGYYVRSVDGVRQQLVLGLLVNEENAEQVRIAEKIARDFTECGIPVTVSAVSFDEYWAKIGAGDYDMLIEETELPANLDPTVLISSAGNIFKYGNAGLDTLVAQTGMTREDEQLMELFKQYGETILNDMPFCALFFRKGDVLSGSKIKSGLSPSISTQFRNSAYWSVR